MPLLIVESQPLISVHTTAFTVKNQGGTFTVTVNFGQMQIIKPAFWTKYVAAFIG